MAVAALLMFGAGLLVGLMLRQKPASTTFLRRVKGSPPHWSVDHLAYQVAQVAQKFEGKRGAEAVHAIRSSVVEFVPHRFSAHDPSVAEEHGCPVCVTYGGRIYVQDGEGWERRLAWALIQRSRIELYGTPERPQESKELPQFSAADRAAQEVADAVVPRYQDSGTERGVVRAER